MHVITHRLLLDFFTFANDKQKEVYPTLLTRTHTHTPPLTYLIVPSHTSLCTFYFLSLVNPISMYLISTRKYAQNSTLTDATVIVYALVDGELAKGGAGGDSAHERRCARGCAVSFACRAQGAQGHHQVFQNVSVRVVPMCLCIVLYMCVCECECACAKRSVIISLWSLDHWLRLMNMVVCVFLCNYLFCFCCCCCFDFCCFFFFFLLLTLT